MTDDTRSCTEWRALMPDALTGELDEETSRALERHLDECDACATEMRLLSGVWTDLGDLPEAGDRPDARSELMDRIRAEIATGSETTGVSYGRARGEGSPHSGVAGRRTRIGSRLSQAAVVLLVFAGGFVVGRSGGKSSDDLPGRRAAAGTSYLLLLHENESYAGPPVEEAVAEYARWAEDVASSGRLVGAEKLTDEAGIWLSGPGADRLDTGVGGAAGAAEPSAEAVAGRATGFFIITAPSEAAAVNLAATTPHLKYNGVVQIRELEDVGD